MSSSQALCAPWPLRRASSAAPARWLPPGSMSEAALLYAYLFSWFGEDQELHILCFHASLFWNLRRRGVLRFVWNPEGATFCAFSEIPKARVFAHEGSLHLTSCQSQS